MNTRTLFRIACLALLAGCSPNRSLDRPVGDAGAAPSPPAAPRAADEGMWTFDNLPLDDLRRQYGFAPSPEWLEHVRLSAVRFGGASGAFVSPRGLVLTNHHVALGQLQKLSTPDRDYVRSGFLAGSLDDELRCPDQELNVLVSQQDVTDRVASAVDPAAPRDLQNRQRKAEIARIEKESTEQTRLKSVVVTLYQGGQYVLYRYRKYTDVRLVFAPDFQAAFFGGDPDNFTYPRFCLDFAFFRVYEDGRPAATAHFLKFRPSGPAEGELVFVAGHPGHTNRLRTVAELQHDRDVRLPAALQILKRRRRTLAEYAARGAEQARQVQSAIFGVENSLKATTGYYEGLLNPAVFRRLAEAERDLRDRIARRPDLASSASGSFDRIAAALQKAAARQKQSTHYPLGGSRLLGIASQIVRYVAEVEKPNDGRYEEFRDSNLESLRQGLFSPAPVYPELEEFLLAAGLGEAREALGPDDPLVAAALEGAEPAPVAHRLVGGTTLADPAARKALVEGGRAAVEGSGDPLIAFARRLDPLWRELRGWHEDNVQSVEVLEGQKIAGARFAIYGRSAYPDATGTLRLSFGRAIGYESGTTRVPWKTTFHGLIDRAASFDNKPPFDLPKPVAERRAEINLDTPLDFVTTNDIIGGNSGSPVVNRNGEYVGLIFDVNIQGLVGSYVYSDAAGRAVAVHAAAIREALRTIYRAPRLLEEMGIP
jgi:hypothetical protein